MKTTNEELVALIQAGDRELLPQLWAQIEKFVWWKAYALTAASGGEYVGMTAEDLHDAGYIAMCAAVDNYNPDVGTKFITFLWPYLRGTWQAEAGLHAQHPDPLLSCTSLDTPLSNEPDSGTLGDMQEDPDNAEGFDDVEHRIYCEQLRNALDTVMGNTISPTQSEVLRMRFYDEATFATIAQRLNTTPERARKAEGDGLNAIRRSRYKAELEQYIDRHTNYYYSVGVNRFNTTQTSAVEEIVFKREASRDNICPKLGRANCLQA